MSKYPEHEKLEQIKYESQLCGEFLEWLQEKFIICEYLKHHQIDNFYAPASINKEKLLAEFFGIDLDKLEAEKRQMLNELKAIN